MSISDNIEPKLNWLQQRYLWYNGAHSLWLQYR